ncbi:MAG: hypothetical protein ACREHE_16040 [Rhizomicrobium sp.]
MLVFEIAAGIVLAVVILANLETVIVGAVVIGRWAIGLGALVAFLLWLRADPSENLGIIAFVGGFMTLAWVFVWVTSDPEDAGRTLRRTWNKMRGRRRDV